ncbi:MAG: N-acetylneuraminate synthase [Phycisphaera sp.]|nr:N-acetylneuraminate synthase [Phycisphaera sp.]
MVTIAQHTLGPGHPCLTIAEAGVNHNGDTRLAHRLVDAAAKAGAWAVKFQVFRADQTAGSDARKAEYQARQTGDGTQSQRDMLAQLELPFEVYREVKAHCDEAGIVFLASPFDLQSATFLAEIGSPAIKIPSGEITHTALLRHVARLGLPLLVSTGMSSLDEVDACLKTLRDAGQREVVLLHCLSNYPADPGEVNLRAMATMRDRYQIPVGFSDHTLGATVAIAAAALGAAVIEKHLTLDRSMVGPDHAASLEPGEFAEMVRGIGLVESALGDGEKKPMPSELNTRDVARRSLVASRDLPVGHVLTAEDFVALRPGTGVCADRLDELIGKKLARPLARGQRLGREDYNL